jgi:predicted O-methyltransferase YrrM
MFIERVRATVNDLPPAVLRAIDAAASLGFGQICRPETGRLLQTLAATVTSGVVAEFGTGCGYGAAWIAAGLHPGARLFTVESDERKTAAARDVLGRFANVEVVCGDWQSILSRGPFRLAFVDARPAKHDGAPLVIDSLAPGAIAIIDDLTPEELWPDEWRGQLDPVRERWLNDPRLIATEVRVTAQHAVILAVRTRT